MDGTIMLQIRESLLAKWRKIESMQIRVSQVAADMYPPQAEIIDMAQALEQIGRDASLQEAERRELLAIEKALAKMATGNFGVCEECSEDIPSKRLMVVPEARLCANCQTIEERQNSRIRVWHTASR